MDAFNPCQPLAQSPPTTRDSNHDATRGRISSSFYLGLAGAGTIIT